jgi:predicted dehydrogenase
VSALVPISAPLGYAIVGPGKVAHTHARALHNVPDARLIAVCGRDSERTRAFADQYRAKPYTSLESTLEDPQVQVVILCTPHPQHAEAAIAAARAGRHVLVEKPMALTLLDCEGMIATAKAHSVKLGVISQRRLYEPVQRVKNAILEGRIGRPILGTVSLLGWRGPEYYAMDAWRGSWAGEGGGVLVNQAAHQLDLFVWFMGEIESVHGLHANLNHPEIEVEDTAVALVRFSSGALGSIVVSNSQNPGLWGRIHVHGSNGASIGVQTDGGSMFISGVTTTVEPPINDLWTIPGETHRLHEWQLEDRARAERINVMTHYHQLQLEDFTAAVLLDHPPLVPGEEGRKAIAIIEAIYRGQV